MAPTKTIVIPNPLRTIVRGFGVRPVPPRDPNLRAGSPDPVSPIAATFAACWFHADKSRSAC